MYIYVLYLDTDGIRTKKIFQYEAIPDWLQKIDENIIHGSKAYIYQRVEWDFIIPYNECILCGMR